MAFGAPCFFGGVGDGDTSGVTDGDGDGVSGADSDPAGVSNG